MSRIDVELPKLGESIVSATISRWLVKVGDLVQLDEPLVEVATDKVNSEIPSPVKGTIVEILAEVDETVDVGSVIARIQTEEAIDPSLKEEGAALAGEGAERAVGDNSGLDSSEAHTVRPAPLPGSSSQIALSPAVLRLAQEHGLSLDVIGTIRGTGEAGRVSKRDVLEFIQKAQNSSSLGRDKDSKEDSSRVKMSALRKAIADNMVRSFYAAPHASLVQEVDVTDLRSVIKKHKEAFLEKHGAKLTLTSFVAKALAEAIKAYPWINSFLEDDTIVVKKRVNLGLAVAIEGGVIVPVIHDSQNMPLCKIAKAVVDLSARGRSGNLKVDEMKGGSITLTNFGMSGVVIGIPIIRFPEVAIVGLGAVKKVPSVDSAGNIVVREKMHISLTFDHRVLDGMYGCGFLNELKTQLEEKAMHFLEGK